MGNAEKINILIADDEVESCRFIQKGLSLQGLNVDIVFDGREAMDSIERKKYDFIFLDYDMPELNGVEVASIIRQKGLSSVVVMITGYSSKDHVFSQAVGVDEYLEKPFLLEKIKALITKHTEKGKGSDDGKKV